MKIITWNIHSANEKSDVWKFLSELNADIVLLQEVVGIPQKILEKYNLLSRKAIYKTGKYQRFSTAVLTKGKIINEIHLESNTQWGNKELEFFSGNFIGCIVQLPNKEQFNVISAYSPVWPVNRNNLKGIDVSQIKLKQNPDIWATEILGRHL